MKNFTGKIALALMSATILFTGCYREELNEIKKEVDAINISSIEQQVSSVKASLSDIEALKSQIAPALDSLNANKNRMESELAEEKKKAEQTGEITTESQAKILSLETRIAEMEAAIEQLSEANLDARINELKEYVNEMSESLGNRLGTLEENTKQTAELAKKSLEDLANLQAALDLATGSFDAKFEELLNKNKENIIVWVSKSKVITDLFGAYYTKEKVEDMLTTIDLYNYMQEDEIDKLAADVKTLQADIPVAINEAIDGVKRDYAGKIEKINNTLISLDDIYKNLNERLVILEELPAVVGDYSNYKGTLVQDILKLQGIVGKDGEDGTLTALVNTLKLLLTDSEGNYYDFAQILADIAKNKSEIGNQDARIKAIEDLVPTFASLEKYTNLKGVVDSLELEVSGNDGDIATLVKRVNDIVAQWTDAVFDQIKTNTQDIVNLKAEDVRLWLAIGSDGTDGSQKSGILGLIADINNKIAELKVEELWTSVDSINDLLETCGVGGIKGLQANMDSFDARIKAIWDLIGTDDLFMEGTLINAINYINAKFGNIGDTTVAALIQALQADVALIKGTGWTSGMDLASLSAALTALQTDLESKADKLTVEQIQSDVANIQETLKTLITKDDVNAALENYLLSATAAETYATIANLTTFMDTYNAVVGSEDSPAAGTVLARLAALENSVGDGTFTENWTTSLTAAVNTLHSLVGNQSVEHQADSIAASIVNSLVSTILGKEGTTEALAAELNTFINEIKALSVTIGETTYTHTNLDEAIKAVYDILTEYVGDYNSALTSEVTSTVFTSLADRFKAIEDVIGYNNDSTALFFSSANTITTAIANLNAMIGNVDLAGQENIATLISTLQGTYDNLVTALFGEGGIPSDASLYNNLNQLKDRLDTLGFTNIHGTDKDGNSVTLKDELDKLNASLDAISERIGTGFGKDTTIVMALEQFKKSLGDFTNAKYTATITGINNDIDALINAICGLSSGGTLQDVKDFREKFETIADLLYNVTNGSITGLTEILEDYETRISQLYNWIGDKGNLGSLYSEIQKIKEDMNTDAYKKAIADMVNFDSLKARLGIADLEAKLGNLEELKTSAKGNLVSAINEIYLSLDGVGELTKKDLEDVRDAIIGEVIEGKELTYGTISKLSQVLDGLVKQVGSAPDDWGERGTLYVAIMNMESSLSQILGENETGYTTVWGAIADLKRIIEEQMGDDTTKGLNELLYSCVYIPEYADGKVQLNCTKGRTSYGEIVMKFQIDAADAFYANWDSGKYKVAGICKSLKTRTKADYENTLEATASLSGKTLTVSMSGTQLENLPSTGDAMVAVTISETEGTGSFTSPFVILTFNEITSDKALIIDCNATPNAYYSKGTGDPEGTFTFYTGANDAKGTISIMDNIGNGYTVSKTGDWFDIVEGSNKVEVTVNSIADYSNGSIVIKANGSKETHTILVKEQTYSFKLGTVAEGLTKGGTDAAPVVTANNGANGAYNGNEIVVTPSSPIAYNSGYEVSGTPTWLTVTPADNNGNAFGIALSANYEDGPRSQEVTLTSKDGSGKALSFTVTQPKLVYTFTLGNPTDEKLAKNGTTLTAPASIASYTVPFTCSPKYLGTDYDVVIPDEAEDWLDVTASKTSDGSTGTISLSFKTKNTTGANRSASATVKTTDRSGSSFEVTAVQKPLILYTFGLGDPGTGFTKSGTTLTAKSGAAGTFSDVTITSSPEYKGKFTVDGDGDWITVSGSDNKLTIALQKYETASTESRSKDITIKSEDGESPFTFTVAQPPMKYNLSYNGLNVKTKDLFGNNALTESNGVITVWYASGRTYTGEVKINLDGYTGDLTSESAGFSKVSVDADGKVTFTMAENTSYSDDETRSLTIKPKDDNPNVTPVTIKFKQLHKQIQLSDDSHKFTSYSDSFSLNVAINYSYSGKFKFTDSPSYNRTAILSASFTYSNDNEKADLKITISGSTTSTRRTRYNNLPNSSTVYVKTNDEKCSAPITVTK